MVDRPIVYTGEVPLGDDFLLLAKYTMIALAKMGEAVFGTSGTYVDGLACVPDSPASLHVSIGPGSILSLQNIDGSAYGDIAADTTHQILKHAYLLDATLLSCPAPATTGNSIVYLIQANYQDSDTDAAVLPYFNSSDPTSPFAGPANSGTSQNKTRKALLTLSVKAGVSATTGTQVQPSPDAGKIGLWAVTVANGATTIISGNITPASGITAANGTTAFWSSPFLSEKLQDKVSIATGDARWGSGGTARTRLTNDTTFHVSTAGNDTTGDGSSGAPWATLQKAINYIYQHIDLAGFIITISVADGTYTTGAGAMGPLPGGGQLKIIGNTTTPANCIISTTSAGCLGASFGGVLQVGGFKVQTTTGGDCLHANDQGSISIVGPMEYGACAGAHRQALGSGSQIIDNQGFAAKISGGATAHMIASILAEMDVTGTTITLTGTPAFSNAFAVGSRIGMMYLVGNTYSGSATGAQYSVVSNSVIDTNGATTTWPTGLSGTTASSGGQII